MLLSRFSQTHEQRLYHGNDVHPCYDNISNAWSLSSKNLGS